MTGDRQLQGSSDSSAQHAHVATKQYRLISI